jgi:hypothetical protein
MTDHGHNPAVALLADPALDPIFRPPTLPGVPSAWHGHVPFAQWIVAALRPDCLVELGTHFGVSFAAFCDAVQREALPTRCYAVDTWKGDEHAGFYGEEVYEQVARFNAEHFADFSEMLRMTFDEALSHFPDGKIDLLHIDGLHTYEAVKRDFEQWRPKLSSRAVVLFHDTNVREREFGVWRLWEELRGQYPGFEFLHAHGLGVLVTGPDAPERVRALAALTDEGEITRIRERFAAIGEMHIRMTDAERERERAVSERDGTVEERDTLRTQAEFIRQERDTLAAETLGLRHTVRQQARALERVADDVAALKSHEFVARAVRETLQEAERRFATERETLLGMVRKALQDAEKRSAAERETLLGAVKGEVVTPIRRGQADITAQLTALGRQRTLDIEALRSAVDHDRIAVEEMTGDRSALRERLDRVEALMRSFAETEALQAQLRAIHGSTSWQLTAPLRGFIRMVRRR